MKHVVSLMVTLVCCLSLDAQQTVNHFPKGCYVGINSLVNGWVAQFTPCEVYEKSSSDRYTEYLLYDSASGKKIEPVFAYSTGDTLYLCQEVYRPNSCYAKSLEVGRFLYFQDLYKTRSSAALAAAVALAGYVPAYALSGPKIRNTKTVDFSGIGSGSVCGIVVDTKVGVIRGVNPENFADVFADFPETVAKFNRSGRQLEDIRMCVRELNKQY